MSKGLKPGQPAAFGFIGIYGKLVEISPARVGDMVRASGHRPAGPLIIDINGQGGIDADFRSG